MVNKGSFFQRLKERWGSGSGVRVSPAHPAASRGAGDPRTAAGLGTPGKPKVGDGAARPAEKPVEKPAEKPVAIERPAAAEKPAEKPVQRVEPERQPVASPVREVATGFAPVDAKSTRKLSDREEAMLVVGAHFQELTSVLRASQARQDDQMGQLIAAATSLTTLPTLGQQQLELLQGLSSHMERQHALGERLATTLTTLPALLQNVESALARAAATDERTAATVREFQATMDRIHGSMSQMVAHSDAQAKATQALAERRDDELQQIGKGLSATQEAQQKATVELRRTTDEGLQSLRRSNEDQSNRLQKAVQENARWNRAVLVGIGLLVVGIGALIVLQFVR